MNSSDGRAYIRAIEPLDSREEKPMGSMESDVRWQQLAALRDELERPAVVVPICVSRIDGKPRELSPRAMRFAEALSFSDGWSRISDARSRRLAA